MSTSEPQEGADAVGHDGQATLDAAGDDPVDQQAFVEGLLEIVPGGDALGLLARQTGFAETVFQCIDCDVNEVTDADFEFTAIIVELIDGNVALGLQAGVDDNEVLIDAHDFSGDDFTGAHFLQGKAFLEKSGKAFFKGGGGVRHRGKNPEPSCDGKKVNLRKACPGTHPCTQHFNRRPILDPARDPR